MIEDKIRDVIQAASRENRLSCEQAHDLAQKLNVSLKEIGGLCDELKIKIIVCQLGCF